jgi:hypothetical protein
LGGSITIVLAIYLFILGILFIVGKIKLFDKIDKYLLIYFLLIAHIPLSILWSDSPNYGLDKLFLFCPLVLTSIFSSKIILKNFNFFLKIFLLLIIIILGYLAIGDVFSSINNILLKGGSISLDEEAVNASNSIGNLFAFSILICVCFFQTIRKSYYKILIIIMIISCLILLLSTGSRSPLIALFSSLFISRFIISNKKLYFLLFLLFLLILFIVIDKNFIYQITPESIHFFLDLRYLSESAGDSFNERLFYYKQALEGIFSGNILEIFFGHGLGDFSHYVLNRDVRLYPHNFLLEISYEFGLIFLILFTYLNLKLIAMSRNIYFRNKFYWLNIFYYYFLIRSMFSGDITGNHLLFLFLFMIFLYRFLIKNNFIFHNH